MQDHCTGELTTLTWDAMWCNKRDSRVEVPNISRSFHTHEIEENQMSDETPFNKPIDPKKVFEDFTSKAKDTVNNPPTPELEQAKSFIERNQKEIAIGLVTLVGLRVYKRKVAKATAKQVLKTLEKAGKNADNSDLPNLFAILEDLRLTPGMAYIPHGGGMVHLLKGRDAIITIFGDFEKMTNEEIWNQVANVLNLGIRTP